MPQRSITGETLASYKAHLQSEEKAAATVQKYMHDLREFAAAVQGGELTKNHVIAYKTKLLQQYATASVNAKLAAVNGLLSYLGWYDCRVHPVKVQTSAYLNAKRELTQKEYLRLLDAAQARGNTRLFCLLQTICATGIRVSEVPFITVEALQRGVAQVHNKGKTRLVFLPQKLCERLLAYCKKQGIQSGCVFITRTGRPISRVSVWMMMKSLCKAARVAAEKVFPHNLRHLFAQIFYQKEHDIEHLASLLGHSHIDTTRIYTKTSGAEHRRQIERLNLVI